MIPSGYKEDTVFSAIPTDGSGDLSFTRSGNGTRINSAGLVEVCPWNMLQYSEQIDNGVWTKFSPTSVTADTTTAPNGTATADTISTSATAVIRQSITLNANETYTYSIYVKKISYDFFGFQSLISGTGVKSVFDLSNGTVTSQGSGHTTLIESVGNGWYRCIITFNVGSSASNIFDLAADGTSATLRTFYAWGAQTNVGSTAKPYFPTTDRLNVPRLTYQNGGGGCPSLLLEKQSTNYFPYSQNISLWYAPADGVTLTSNTTDTVSPDGTNNASKIAIVSGSKRSYEITNSVAGVGTFSAYVKAGTSTSITLFTSSGSINIGYNLSTLAITTGSGTGTITSVGNGWYRITATNTLGASEVLQVLYTGTAGQTIYIWGFQVEASSYVTSYIFTNGASATRVADVCNKYSISSLIGQTEGTIFGQLSFPNLGALGGSSYLYITDGSFTNSVIIGREPASPNSKLFFYIDAGGSNVLNNTANNLQSGFVKMALAYKSGNWAAYLNGTLVASGTSTFTFSANMTRFGIGTNDGSITSMGDSMIASQAVLFPTRLTNAELASLTTI
jgi:hypothetical protein